MTPVIPGAVSERYLPRGGGTCEATGLGSSLEVTLMVLECRQRAVNRGRVEWNKLGWMDIAWSRSE